MADDVFEMRADGSAVIRLHVQPGAGRTEVVGRHGDALKVRVAAAPERGRANEACASLLAEALGVDGSAVSLTTGGTSRSKRFAVTGVEPDDLRRALEGLTARSRSETGVGNAGRRQGVHRHPR